MRPSAPGLMPFRGPETGRKLPHFPRSDNAPQKHIKCILPSYFSICGDIRSLSRAAYHHNPAGFVSAGCQSQPWRLCSPTGRLGRTGPRCLPPQRPRQGQFRGPYSPASGLGHTGLASLRCRSCPTGDFCAPHSPPATHMPRPPGTTFVSFRPPVRSPYALQELPRNSSAIPLRAFIFSL